MGNKIALLPDNVANQIAAGEVVQRPASAVKELLENALDASATEIHLIVKDAGKTLIQVIDNGDGMSEVDARMAFERHATSKIKSAEDLFLLSTKGFRGEALASIAAVAQVECKTKRPEDDVTSELKIEGSKVIAQGYGSGITGTTISVKNLFFNIPARRNFLKSNQVEFKHIIDEFERVSLAHENVHFKLTHNANVIFDLPRGNQRQRIAGVFGKKYNERLVPLEEMTDVVKLEGFIVKPQFAKRSRGEQFFFVNNRFIKSPFLHKAILQAFEGLISLDQHPAYFIFMEIDPARIDVNIHPTKTEIKFDDEPAIFAILRSTIKKSLGQFNVAPSLDFELGQQFTPSPLKSNAPVSPPRVDVDPEYNPFKEETVLRTAQKRATGQPLQPQNQPWEQMFEGIAPTETSKQLEVDAFVEEEREPTKPVLLHGKYILIQTKSGFTLIKLKMALERIYFEQFLTQFNKQSTATQQLLFPNEIELSSGDISLLKEVEQDLAQLGFDIHITDKKAIISGIPLQLTEGEIDHTIDRLLDSLQSENRDLELDQHKLIAKQLAFQVSQQHHSYKTQEELISVVDRLFACENPYLSIQGRPIIAQLDLDEFEKYFN